MRKLMIDIETLDSSTTAAVIAIGACVFDEETIHSDFEVLISADEAAKIGTSSLRTLAWWRSQDPAVMERMFSGTTSPKDAVVQLCEFIHDARVDEVWANSPTFDCAILQHLFRQVGVKCPWPFRAERCVRTAYAIARWIGIDYSAGYTEKNAHDARSDARNQARAVGIILKALGHCTLDAKVTHAE